MIYLVVFLVDCVQNYSDRLVAVAVMIYVVVAVYKSQRLLVASRT